MKSFKTFTVSDLHALGAFIFTKGVANGVAGTRDGRAFIPCWSQGGWGWYFRETTPARAAIFAVRNGLAELLPSDVVECVHRRQPRSITRLA